jgi:predicted MPP superfamily phosphohydrolase
LAPSEEAREDLNQRLRVRLGALHARQRLGIEAEHETHVFGGGISFFHLENWYSAHAVIRGSLKIVGLYNRARRNAHAIRVVHNLVKLPSLPVGCDGLRILHLSDLHIDMSEDLIKRLIECVSGLEYDLCVLTGDYRFRTYGNADLVMGGMKQLKARLHSPVYAVLGNHDSVKMLPDLEDIGIRVLMNEHVVFEHNTGALYLAGIDDAHFFGVDNIEKAMEEIPEDACCVLLSHTPEVYRKAAHAGADLLLCGHTHGGQICLPGGYPLTLDARIPRKFGNGSWQYATMLGYTSPGAGSSMVDVRLNCPPEVTVHRLSTGDRERLTST